MMNRKSLISLLIVLSNIVFFACQLDIPVKEMTNAKKIIDEAESFRASKYAPSEISIARNQLLKSHNFLKAEDTDKAKESALNAFKSASEAVEKSLPPLSSDTIKQAVGTLEMADYANASKYDNDNFLKAGELKKQADLFYSEKKFRNSYKFALKSISLAEKARMKSLQNLPVLEESVKSLLKRYDTMAAGKWKEEVLDDLTIAKTKLSITETNFQEGKLKDALLNILEAESALDSAEKKISSAEEKERLEKLKVQKEKAEARITEIQNKIDKMQKAPGADFARDELDVAKTKVTEATDLNKKNDPASAEVQLDEAEQLLVSAGNKIKAGVLKERITGIKKQHSELTEKDTAGLIKKDLDKAAELISEADKFIEADDYVNTALKADEAEGLLNSLSLTLTSRSGDNKADQDAEVKQDEKKEIVIYTVRLNRKKRDCLWRIAGRFYKEPHLWPVIYMANRDKIKDPDLIFPGQKFIIPAKPKRGKKRWDNIYKKENSAPGKNGRTSD